MSVNRSEESEGIVWADQEVDLLYCAARLCSFARLVPEIFQSVANAFAALSNARF